MKFIVASVALLATSSSIAFPVQDTKAIGNATVPTAKSLATAEPGNNWTSKFPYEASNAILHPYYTCMKDMVLRQAVSTTTPSLTPHEVKVTCQDEVLTNPDLDLETKHQLEQIFHFSNVKTPTGAEKSGVKRQVPPEQGPPRQKGDFGTLDPHLEYQPEEQLCFDQYVGCGGDGSHDDRCLSTLQSCLEEAKAAKKTTPRDNKRSVDDNGSGEDETPFQKYVVKANQCQIAHEKCSGERCERIFDGCMAEAEALGQLHDTKMYEDNPGKTKREDHGQDPGSEINPEDNETFDPLDPAVLDLRSFQTYAEEYEARWQALLHCTEEDRACSEDTQACNDKFHQCQDAVAAEHDEQVQQKYDRYRSDLVMENRSYIKRSEYEATTLSLSLEPEMREELDACNQDLGDCLDSSTLSNICHDEHLECRAKVDPREYEKNREKRLDLCILENDGCMAKLHGDWNEEFCDEMLGRCRANVHKEYEEKVKEEGSPRLNGARALSLHKRFPPMNRPDAAGRPPSLMHEIQEEEAICAAEYHECLKPGEDDGKLIPKNHKEVGLCGNAQYNCEYKARGLPPLSPTFECGDQAAWGHGVMPGCKPLTMFDKGSFDEQIYQCAQKQYICGRVATYCLNGFDMCIQKYSRKLQPQNKEPWNRYDCTEADRESGWDRYTNDIGIAANLYCPTNDSTERGKTEGWKEKWHKELTPTGEGNAPGPGNDTNEKKVRSLSRIIGDTFKKLFASKTSRNATLINPASGATETKPTSRKAILPHSEAETDSGNDDNNPEICDDLYEANQNLTDTSLTESVHTSRSVSSPPYHDDGGDDGNPSLPCWVFCKIKRNIISAIRPILPRYLICFPRPGEKSPEGCPTFPPEPEDPPSPCWGPLKDMCISRRALAPSLLARRRIGDPVDQIIEEAESDDQNDLTVKRTAAVERPDTEAESESDHLISGSSKIIGSYCDTSEPSANVTNVGYSISTQQHPHSDHVDTIEGSGSDRGDEEPSWQDIGTGPIPAIPAAPVHAIEHREGELEVERGDTEYYHPSGSRPWPGHSGNIPREKRSPTRCYAHPEGCRPEFWDHNQPPSWYCDEHPETCTEDGKHFVDGFPARSMREEFERKDEGAESKDVDISAQPSQGDVNPPATEQKREEQKEIDTNRKAWQGMGSWYCSTHPYDCPGNEMAIERDTPSPDPDKDKGYDLVPCIQGGCHNSTDEQA